MVTGDDHNRAVGLSGVLQCLQQLADQRIGLEHGVAVAVEQGRRIGGAPGPEVGAWCGLRQEPLLGLFRHGIGRVRPVQKDEAEEGYVVKNTGEYKLDEGQVVVKVDPKYYRPTEVDLLIGDPTKAITKLGWKPKYDLAALVKEMVASDVSLFKKELYIKQSGL